MLGRSGCNDLPHITRLNGGHGACKGARLQRDARVRDADAAQAGAEDVVAEAVDEVVRAVRHEHRCVLLRHAVEGLHVAAAHGVREVEVRGEGRLHAALLELHALRHLAEQQADDHEPLRDRDRETLGYHGRLRSAAKRTAMARAFS